MGRGSLLVISLIIETHQGGIYYYLHSTADQPGPLETSNLPMAAELTREQCAFLSISWAPKATLPLMGTGSDTF